MHAQVIKMEKISTSIKKKIGSRSGETIAETLIALLIAALALTMLAGAISYAFNMIRESRRNLEAYYDTANDMASLSGGSDKTVTVSWSADESLKKSYTVTCVENTAFRGIKVASYKYEE